MRPWAAAQPSASTQRSPALRAATGGAGAAGAGREVATGAVTAGTGRGATLATGGAVVGGGGGGGGGGAVVVGTSLATTPMAVRERFESSDVPFPEATNTPAVPRAAVNRVTIDIANQRMAPSLYIASQNRLSGWRNPFGSDRHGKDPV